MRQELLQPNVPLLSALHTPSSSFNRARGARACPATRCSTRLASSRSSDRVAVERPDHRPTAVRPRVRPGCQIRRRSPKKAGTIASSQPLVGGHEVLERRQRPRWPGPPSLSAAQTNGSPSAKTRGYHGARPTLWPSGCRPLLRDPLRGVIGVAAGVRPATSWKRSSGSRPRAPSRRSARAPGSACSSCGRRRSRSRRAANRSPRGSRGSSPRSSGPVPAGRGELPKPVGRQRVHARDGRRRRPPNRAAPPSAPLRRRRSRARTSASDRIQAWKQDLADVRE